MIYAPDLKKHPLSTSQIQAPRAPLSEASSFSNIGHDEARTPGEESGKSLASLEPNPVDSPTESPFFRALYNQAQALVEKETMIMPFTTQDGHIHILRHLAPEIVYIQESMSGSHGDAVTHMARWVGQVVVVIGDEGGRGGLVDTEDEEGLAAEKADHWWENDGRVGLGKGIEIVDGLRVGEDWRRRVSGHD